MRSILVAFTVVVSLAGSAGAETPIMQTRVSAVALHPDGARITREFSIDLPAGNHRLEFRDFQLPGQIGSIQFDFGSPDVAISGVSFLSGGLKPMPSPEAPELAAARQALRAAEATLRDLTYQRRGLEAQAEAARAEIAYLSGLGKSSDDSAMPDATALTATSQAIGAAYLEARTTALTAERAIEDLAVAIEQADRDLREALAYYAGLNPGTGSDALAFDLTMPAALSGKATLSYLTRDANWSANYELHLTQSGAKGSALLNRRALITSYGREHWTNAVASLSTAEVNVTTNINDPNEQIAVIRDVVQLKLRAQSEADTLFAESAPMVEPIIVADEARGGFAPSAPPVLKGQVLEFSLPAPLTLRGGGGAIVALDRMTIDVGLSVKIVPAISDSAFLIARMTNATGGPILPGNVYIFRDGAYIGEGRMPAVGIGEEIEFSFGEYDGIEVRRDLLQRIDGDIGIITSTNNRIERYITTITNHLDTAMPIRVLDNHPVTEQEDLVIRTIARPMPSEQDVDGKRGVMAWQFQLAPGDQKAIEFGYEAQWPKDQRLIIR